MPTNNKIQHSSGQGLIEYALILVLMSGVVILSLNLMGLSVREGYCSVVEGFGSATGCGCSFGFDDLRDKIHASPVCCASQNRK